MKKTLIAAIAFTQLIFNINQTKAQEMNNIIVNKHENLSSIKVPETNFTGDVNLKTLFPKDNPSSFSSGVVSFEKGARTNWHTHPQGQMLYILSGIGQVQEWGKEIIEVRAGDVVWFPANIKHWHGASKDSAMSHLAITPIDNGKSADWMEKVTNEQYGD